VLERRISREARRLELRRARDRRWRRREAAGRCCVTVEIDDAVVDLLVRARWLEPREVFTRAELAGAITRMLREASRQG
jgi:hypothetical protein